MTENKGTVVALGNFDGLHTGHMRVIGSTVRLAAERGLAALVLVFDSSPYKVLGRGATENIMTARERKESIEKAGAKEEIIDFKAIKDMKCEDFVERILIEKLNARAVCCGFNYHFGSGAKGDAKTLREICGKKEIETIVCESVDYKGAPISSSRIRKCILSGNMYDANKMLGREFSYDFEVTGGDRIGRKLGAPTINQFFPKDFAVPLYGVYASKTVVDGREYASVTNVGVRPTTGKPQLRSETYILDFSGNLYGQRIKVSLVKYIRSEKKFGSLEELKNQIKTDCKRAKEGNGMEKIKVKAIFFDFDDTLQSRKGAYRLYCEAFVSKYFPNIGKEERETKLNDMEERVDGGYKDREVYFPELIELWKWNDHPPMQELYDSFNEDYGKYVVMLPHTLETLSEIKRRGFVMGIISNGVSVLQNTKLDTAGIRDMFDVTVVSGDFGVYKPDRRIFDEACRQAGFDNGECLFVGDHPVNDIRGAIGAGMRVVRMNQGDFYNKEIDSNIPTIEDLGELLDMVCRG